MTFFSKIFGKKSTPSQQESDVAPIERDLFLEDRHPREIYPESETKTGTSPILQSLLQRDYFTIGQRDGYEDHDASALEEHLEVIAAEFRETLYHALAEIEERKDHIASYLTDQARESMPHQCRKMEVKLMQLESQCKEIMRQIDLAPMGEGYIERPVKMYKAGFHKGFDLWLKEDELFIGPKTI